MFIINNNNKKKKRERKKVKYIIYETSLVFCDKLSKIYSMMYYVQIYKL
jgi:hypothetical protein